MSHEIGKEEKQTRDEAVIGLGTSHVAFFALGGEEHVPEEAILGFRDKGIDCVRVAAVAAPLFLDPSQNHCRRR